MSANWKKIGVAFSMPTTLRVNVVWKGAVGVLYRSNIPNPRGMDGLQAAMLAKHVGIGQIVRVEGVK